MTILEIIVWSVSVLAFLIISVLAWHFIENSTVKKIGSILSLFASVITLIAFFVAFMKPDNYNPERVDTIPTSTSPSTAPPSTASIQREDIARWEWNWEKGVAEGPDAPTPALPREIILLHGDLQGIPQTFFWRIFHPGETICKPVGESVAAKIWGGTETARVQEAQYVVQKVIPKNLNLPDWNQLEATEWCQ